MVVRMDQKKVLIACISAFVIIAISCNTTIACENDEENKEPNDNNCNKKLNLGNDYSFIGLISSGNLFDRLCERYPLLDTIIQLILELIYNWFSNYNLQSLIS